MEQRIAHDISLKNLTSIRAGGSADNYIRITSVAEFSQVLVWARKKGLEVTILAGGSNVLISDEGIGGLVIDTRGLKGIQVRGSVLTALAGSALEKVVSVAGEKGLGGMEYFSGLPGTVGGAVYGNAGCWGAQISDYIEWVEYLDIDGRLHTFFRGQYPFSYRDSPFKHDRWFITEVNFNLTPCSPMETAQRAKEYRNRRRESGQYRYPSMGSVFKNPTIGSERYPAGRLIDELGLSELEQDGVRLLEKKANIVINPTGKASSQEIYRLIERLKTEVRLARQIELELEIRLLGRWD